jgi:PPOX class probable F420-dependent enzyme
MELDEDVVRLAKGANLATMVTLMPSGQPQAQLRWIDSDGENLIINTEPQRQAARNVRRDPRVSVLIHVVGSPYDWAEVRGRVVKSEGGQRARDHIDFLSQKYLGVDYQPPVGPEGRVMLWIAPQRVLTPAILSARR